MPIPRPKSFVLFYAIATLVAILLILRRRRPRGMQLRLGQTEREEKAPARSATPSVGVGAPPAKVERELNVMFNYNGHTWDAYEVLDLPAGAAIESVRAAREGALAKVDPASREFIESAYRAILARV